ncbi:hypothetical protein [Legionella tunisiensis]|uniref:hypothetical protein n=1 Tax=Legionella tunisiensis TaxID=1034944 RepID=UPI0012EA1C8F|nr:hypothetical protein [Legionella tunisiensis]
MDSWPAVKDITQPESPPQPYQSAFFKELQLEIARRTQQKVAAVTATEKQSQSYSSPS